MPYNKNVKYAPYRSPDFALLRRLRGRYKAKEFYFLVGFKALLFVNFKQ
jgi:hypothetical protein